MKKVVDNFPNYMIDSSGKVFSISGNFYRKQQESIFGYKVVDLLNKGVRKKIPIHRLVAIHFIENPDNKPQVNHIDGNKHNNDVSNLEWCTASENELHSHKVLGKRPHNIRAVVIEDIKTGEEFEFDSLSEACVFTGAQQANASKVLAGTRKKAGGFRFNYKENR